MKQLLNALFLYLITGLLGIMAIWLLLAFLSLSVVETYDTLLNA